MEVLIWIQSNIDTILTIGTSIIAAASAITALTPTPSDDTVVGKLYKVLDFLALNFGKAKDKGN
jgi:hypothetical protein